ncbi:MAG: glycosyltransferase family 39 protein [Proteobacteria bacterium]|nr:glycosyltransferase family 39 protein [Pseudomonadota bacterium]
MIFPEEKGDLQDRGLSFSRRFVLLGVILLLTAHLALAASSALRKSETSDEPIHQAGGYTYWDRNDYRLQPENGNLPQRLTAIPLLFKSVRYPYGSLAWQVANLWETAFEFSYQSGNPTDFMRFSGRLMIMCLSVLLGLLVFLWSRSLFGPAGGLVSLALYAFSPSMLAHARFMTSDLAAALFFLAAVGMTWRVLTRAGWANLLVSGLALGAVLVSKASGVFILPMAGLMFAGRCLSRTPFFFFGREWFTRRQKALVLSVVLAVQGFIALGVVWGFYGFRFAMTQDPAYQEILAENWDKELGEAGGFEPGIRLLRDHKALPEAYLYGFTYVLTHSKTRRAFLNGEYSTTGWPGFFPRAFGMKTPVVVFLFLAGAGWGLWAGRRRISFTRLAPLAVLFLVYAGFSITSHINIGHRHILPLYPVLFILAGASVLALENRPRLAFPVLAAPLVLLAVQALMIWPHYLAFFNVLAGGPQKGYQHLVDSSLDWGQDLPALKEWLDRDLGPDNTSVPVYLAYFGSASPMHYGLDPYFLPSYSSAAVYDPRSRPEPWKLTGGIFCLSSTLLQQVYTDTFGRWCEPYDRAFRISRFVFLRWLDSLKDPAAAQALIQEMGGEERVREVLDDYKRLRFGRLCHALRKRKPDGFAGYSILIYRVYYQDLEQILAAPAGNLPQDPGILGPMPELLNKWMNYPDPLKTEGTAS